MTPVPDDPYAPPDPPGPPNPPTLPDPPNSADLVAAAAYQDRMQAYLAEWQARQRDRPDAAVAAELARVAKQASEKSDKATEVTADRLFQATAIQSLVQGYITISQSSLDRAVSRGTNIATAAAAVGTAYTTLLGIEYSSKSNPQFVPTAIIPAVFLGLSILFAVAYIAFLKQAPPNGALLGVGRQPFWQQDSELADLDIRLQEFCNWTYGTVRDRAGYLHLSVYSLALGVGFLPTPFLKAAERDEWIFLVSV